LSFTEDLKTGVSPYRQRLNEVLHFLLSYLKNPVHAMRTLPEWDWYTLLAFYTAAAASCGVLAGIISLRFTQVLAGLIVFPISATLGAIILSGFFYYTFSFFFHREVTLKKLFTIVALSLLPFFAVYTISSWLEPLKLIGFGVSSILLTVGLVEHSHVERKPIVRLIGGLYGLYLVFWIFSMISSRSETEHLKDLATPESMETLTKELNK
jgi:hypothetical protein